MTTQSRTKTLKNNISKNIQNMEIIDSGNNLMIKSKNKMQAKLKP